MKFLVKDKRKVILYCIAFLIPIIIMLMVFKELEVSPFGDKSLLTMDLWGQYFPMIAEKMESSLSGHFFSWDGALGFNSFAQSAYYCNSIFYLFLNFVGYKGLINAVDFIILLKFGIASITCVAFLQYKFKKVTPISIAIGTAYSLCSYSLAYLSQVMWTDSIIYFPLILIGLERLVKDKKCIMYTLMLALTIISSFYISFSVCIFLVIYFIVLVISESEKFKIKDILMKCLRFGVYSLVAGGIAAFTILPVYKAISLTLASEISPPETLTFYNTLAEYIYAMFPETKLSFEYGIPNIMSGAFIFILIPLFFFNNGIKFSKKVTYGALLTFLYLSMNINVLNYVWHGFHFPNQLPGRWSFIFSFIVLIMCFEALENRANIKPRNIFVSLIVACGVIGFTKYTQAETLTNEIILKMILVVTSYTVIIALIYLFENHFMKLNNSFQKHFKVNFGYIFTIIMSLAMVLECGKTTLSTTKVSTNVSSIPGYYGASDNIKSFINSYENTENSFYRMELSALFTFDPGQLYQYKGISYYSSTMSGSTFKLLTSLGYNCYGANVSVMYNPSSPILNSLFSIRYMYDAVSKAVPAMECIKDTGIYKAYENKYWLPIAFKTSNNILDINLDDETISSIKKQNNLFNAIMGEDVNVLEEIPLEKPECENVVVVPVEDWSNSYYNALDSSQPVKMTFNYECTQDGALIMEHNFRAGEIAISSVNGDSTVDIFTERVKNLGEFKAGDVVTITVTNQDISTGLYGLKLYHLNEDKFKTACDKLTNSSFQTESFKETNIKGTINMDTDGLVYTSIPDDGGWSVKIDGKKVDTVSILNNSLLAFQAPAGTHNVEFKYSVPGLAIGIVITFISILGLLVLCYLNKLHIKKCLEMERLENEKKANMYAIVPYNEYNRIFNFGTTDINTNLDNIETNDISKSDEQEDYITNEEKLNDILEDNEIYDIQDNTPIDDVEPQNKKQYSIDDILDNLDNESHKED